MEVCISKVFVQNNSTRLIIKFVVISARENCVIQVYRNSFVRVERTNVREKYSSSNSVASQLKPCIESTFKFLKFAANRLRVVWKRFEANRLHKPTILYVCFSQSAVFFRRDVICCMSKKHHCLRDFIFCAVATFCRMSGTCDNKF